MRRYVYQQGDREAQTVAVTDAMSEFDFMDYVLAQLLTGEHPPLVRLTDADLAAIEDERIGEHFWQHPFLY